ncbi:MAG: oligopeptide ABC transporter ATP-binding protein [Thermofilum sp. ex4484_15]|nr:MAG: oligopeptide ABC transporter ATP-binding protein [Thermofilum sp. ex4484_15]
MSSLLKLEDVKVYFEVKRGLRRTFYVKAVDGVSLELRRGSSIVLVGESGCGKTTLGKVAVGLLKPTSGKVLYKGKDVFSLKGRERMEFRRRVQLVHQDPYTCLNPTKTVYAILAAPLKRWGLVKRREELLDKVASLLEEIGIPPEEYLFRYPHQLSGGERQRISLIRALSVDPEVIVADEAVSAVDASIRVELMDLMLKLRGKYNVSYLFITHDLAVARYFAIRSRGFIAVMYLGKILELAPEDEIIKRPLHPYTKALLAAVPVLDLEYAKTREPLPLKRLDVPSPINLPSGCRFHPRCPYAMEVCSREEPLLKEYSKGHYVACHLYDRG